MFKILLVALKRKKYALIASIIAIVFASLSYYLTVNNIYQNSIVIFAEMSGLLFTTVTLVLGAVISILLGINIALLIFKRDIARSRAVGDKISSVGGTVMGVVASGCPSCGASVLGLLGLPLGLLALPLKGIELKLLSVILLVVSIFLVSKSIKKNLVAKCD